MGGERSLAALLGTVVALSPASLGRGVAGRVDRAPAPAPAPAPGAVAAPAAVAASPGATRPGPGFAYGTDSYYPAVGGSTSDGEPVLGGGYGGYMGMVGSWERWLGCSSFLAWSSADAAAADIDRTRHREGVGTGAYWFMGGPGVDPHYNGTAREARAWGAAQAAQTLGHIRRLPGAQRITYPVVWMDVELPKIAPAPDNGWTSVYGSPCRGAVRRRGIAPSVNRAELDGFSVYLRAHSRFQPGVYSSPGNWRRIFGTGAAGAISTTYEWTYRPESAALRQAPAGWCLRARHPRCAQFFGGLNTASRYALMWQFSGGGGVLNGYGDFDQIERARTP
ncbi:MAG: hypothetical protein FWD42_04145 [Solirubrobacterales bacterium]|nr:hypothetical protein [Solirubrobacterales bacterium]